MKRYLIGLFLVLLVAGCQQQAATTEPPATTAPTGQAITEQPSEPAETTEELPLTEEPLLGAQEEPATGSDVSILGKGGFDPEEVTVQKGATVTFTNNVDKLTTLNLWAGKRVIDTVIVKSGAVGEITFDTAGSFEVRTLEYVTSMSVIVE